MKEVVLLGAGISGIAAGYFLGKEDKKEFNITIYEKNSSWGGLCDNFEIDGFRFDKFVHFSFTENKEVKEIFEKSSESIEHIPNPSNYYKGYWLKHPAQNNLYSLSREEKEKILIDFKNGKEKSIEEIKNYEEWLRIQYGDDFAANFPMKYTRKYWVVDAKELETKWVGERMYKPTIEEIKKGIETEDTPITYYAKKMYPKKGGYKSYLSSMIEGLNIELNSEVIKIDLNKKVIYFSNGNSKKYDELISSIPLPELVKMKVIKKEDIIVKDIRYEKYANVLFDFNIYNSRKNKRIF